MEHYVVKAREELEQSAQRLKQKAVWLIVSLVALVLSTLVLNQPPAWEGRSWGHLVLCGLILLFALAFLEFQSEQLGPDESNHFVPVAFHKIVAALCVVFFCGLLLAHLFGLLT